MRIYEFANAEEQLALWKLVSDNMWQALSTQAQQQARAEAERALQAKAKKRTSKRSSAKAPYAPPPPSLPKAVHPKPTPTHVKQPTSVGDKQNAVGIANPHSKNNQPPHVASVGDKQNVVGTTNPHTNLTNPHVPPTQQTVGGRAQTQHYIANPMQQQVQPHTPLTQQQKRLQRQKTAVLHKNTSV
jgi:lipoprotein-anchoring transpeptidase ErfK/SrfK